MDKVVSMTEFERQHIKFDEGQEASNSPWEKVTHVLAEKTYRGKSTKFVGNMAAATYGQISQDIADSWVKLKENGWSEEQVDKAITMSEHKVAERLAKYLSENEVTAVGGVKRLLYSSLDENEFGEIANEVKKEIAQEEERIAKVSFESIKLPDRLEVWGARALAVLGLAGSAYFGLNLLRSGAKEARAEDYSGYAPPTMAVPTPEAKATELPAAATPFAVTSDFQVADKGVEDKMPDKEPFKEGKIDFRKPFTVVVPDETAKAGRAYEGFEIEVNPLPETKIAEWSHLDEFLSLWDVLSRRSMEVIKTDIGATMIVGHSFYYDTNGDGISEPLPFNWVQNIGAENMLGKEMTINQEESEQVYRAVAGVKVPAWNLSARNDKLWGSEAGGFYARTDEIGLDDKLRELIKEKNTLVMVVCDDEFSGNPDQHGFDRTLVVWERVEPGDEWRMPGPEWDDGRGN